MATVTSIVFAILVTAFLVISTLLSMILIFLMVGLPIIFTVGGILLGIATVLVTIFGGIFSTASFGIFGLIGWILLVAGIGSIIALLTTLAFLIMVAVWQLLGLVVLGQFSLVGLIMLFPSVIAITYFALMIGGTKIKNLIVPLQSSMSWTQ